MKNIVLFGGNGYLGRNFIRNWLKHDHDVRFYVLSRSGRDQLKLPEVIDVRVDVSSAENVLKAIPDHVGYIVDFIGAPEKDPTKFDQIIWVPARVMRQVAESLNCQAMGFVGGVLGPKKFTATKKEIIDYLHQSSVRLATVEPTLVYGNGRKDSMTRMVPLLKVLGIFSSRMKPVQVDQVVETLRQRLLNGD